MCVCVWRGSSYPAVLLAGHVCSEDGLHGQGSCLLLSVAFPLHVHPLELLDGCGSLGPAHELGQAGGGEEGGREETVEYFKSRVRPIRIFKADIDIPPFRFIQFRTTSSFSSLTDMIDSTYSLLTRCDWLRGK